MRLLDPKISAVSCAAVFVSEAAEAAPSNAIICSNTMRLDLDQMSENLSQKQVIDSADANTHTGPHVCRHLEFPWRAISLPGLLHS